MNSMDMCKKLWPEALNYDRGSAMEGGVSDTKKATIKLTWPSGLGVRRAMKQI
jgi:hypothetical protein